jgi:NADH-quinone oxidoreductase subunit G
VGANIRLDSRGREVMRILPRVNDDVNEEWLADRARYLVDGLTRRRLDKPWLRVDGKLRAATWAEALAAVGTINPGASVAVIAGDMVDAETMFAAKSLARALGSSMLEGRQTGLAYDTSNLAAAAFNTTFAGIEDADAILIYGSHVRDEAPLLNPRIRKAVRKGAKAYIIGPWWDPTYHATHLGDDASVIDGLPEDVASVFANAARPAIIIGGGALAKGGLASGLAFAARFNLVRDGWNGFNVLHFAAARMAGLMLGYAQPGGIGDIVAAAPRLVISLGADEADWSKFAGSMIVHIGHHGDKAAHLADVILPGAAFSEKDGTYVNTEGRVQYAEKAVFAPGEAREDWTILRALADALGVSVGFDSFAQLRAAMIAEVPELGVEGLADYGALPAAPEGARAAGVIGYPVKDRYLTNAIGRASPTLQRCSAELIHGDIQAEAAE